MNKEENINNGFYENLNTNFEQAFKMSEKEFTHEELLKMLKTGNIPQKQIAALKFDYVKTENDCKALLDNLTGCDGKIREVVALTINRILTEDIETISIFAPLSAEKFADATIDINANICRLVTDSAILLKSDTAFAKLYAKKISQYAKEALNKLDNFIFRDKKYVINKQLFKLYWCLEALKNFHDSVEPDELHYILKKSSEQNEYTIREKTAQIIVGTKIFPEIEKQLKNDENYYVKAVFKSDVFFE